MSYRIVLRPDVDDRPYQAHESPARVQEIARERALQDGRRFAERDLRHACHIIAFGQDRETPTLSNAETDRIVAFFRLVRDPEDIDARLAYDFPENAEVKRLLWRISQVPYAYAVKVCRDKFATDDWHTLPVEQLRQLALTFRLRAPARAPRANCPF